MKVWISMGHVNYEGDEVLGVFSTKKKAEQFNTEEASKMCAFYHDYSVSGWDVEDTNSAVSDTKTYRVELVDHIDAQTEHDAIEIFIDSIDPSDDLFDVYEVDPLTKKAVK